MFECRNCGDPCAQEGGQCVSCSQSKNVRYDGSETGVLARCVLCSWREFRTTKAAAVIAFREHYYPFHRGTQAEWNAADESWVSIDRRLSQWLSDHHVGQEPVVHQCAEWECTTAVHKPGQRCRVHAK